MTKDNIITRITSCNTDTLCGNPPLCKALEVGLGSGLGGIFFHILCPCISTFQNIWGAEGRRLYSKWCQHTTVFFLFIHLVVKATIQNHYIRASSCPVLCRNWPTNILVWRSGMQEGNELKVSQYVSTLLQVLNTVYPYNNGYTACSNEVVVTIIHIIQRYLIIPPIQGNWTCVGRVGERLFSSFLSFHLSIRGRNLFRWGFVYLLQYLPYASLFSSCPSISLVAESCPVCIFHNNCLVHFIYTFHQPVLQGAYTDFCMDNRFLYQHYASACASDMRTVLWKISRSRSHSIKVQSRVSCQKGPICHICLLAGYPRNVPISSWR